MTFRCILKDKQNLDITAWPANSLSKIETSGIIEGWRPSYLKRPEEARSGANVKADFTFMFPCVLALVIRDELKRNANVQMNLCYT
jgi:hypothetical protein